MDLNEDKVMDLQDLEIMDKENRDLNYEQDQDTCSNEELESLFETIYTRFNTMKLDSDSYCTDVKNDSKFSNIAASLSNCKIAVVDANNMKETSRFQPFEKDFSSFNFSPQNDNVIFASSTRGIVKLFDIRTNKAEKELKEETEDKKPITTFDISPNERILCAGTELLEEDAFLLFWDIRGSKLLGGYWESHSDEITCIKFNPDNPDMMASGSVDGLVNIFNVSKDTEDDAFTYCLNAGGTINRIVWEMGKKSKKFLFSIADSAKLDYWNIEESVPEKHFSEEDIAKTVKRKLPEESYIVSIFSSEKSNPIILIGSGMDSGKVTLRSVMFDRDSKALRQMSRFLLQENSKEKIPVVRASLYNPKEDKYITAAENGSLGVWGQSSQDYNRKDSYIAKKKNKSNRSKPY